MMSYILVSRTIYICPPPLEFQKKLNRPPNILQKVCHLAQDNPIFTNYLEMPQLF